MPSKAFIAGRLPVRRGLDESEAAVYLSFSPTFFRKLVTEGHMPRPRLAGSTARLGYRGAGSRLQGVAARGRRW